MSKQHDEKRRRLDRELNVVHDHELDEAKAITEKYDADIELVIVAMVSVQAAGMGRNSQTANALRAAADLIESGVERIEDVEKRVNNPRGES